MAGGLCQALLRGAPTKIGHFRHIIIEQIGHLVHNRTHMLLYEGPKFSRKVIKMLSKRSLYERAKNSWEVGGNSI
jgi:hypothetical protein